MTYKKISLELKKNSNKDKAKILQKFFKTGKGEYGEKDIFIGLTVPKQKQIAQKYFYSSLNDLQKLLDSKIHEERFTGLIILTHQFDKARKNQKEKEMKTIFNFYLKNTKNINNWDLVDLSAPKIVGQYLLEKNKEILFELSNSKKKNWTSLWEKRIAIVSTLTLIKEKHFNETINIAEKYFFEKHDLLHKATGWMLREIGKQDKQTLINFLEKNHKKMPRVMLRYSIEKLDEKERKKYLAN